MIEVSVSSLRVDLGVKAGIYAESGIPELWVIDLPHRIVHVHRQPTGDRYADVSKRRDGLLRALTDGIAAIDLDALFARLDAADPGSQHG